MKQTTTPEAKALQQAERKAAQEANSEKFYKAKHHLFFCEQVIGMAACVVAMRNSLEMIDAAKGIYPKELEKVKSNSPGVNDWHEMPQECIHWALNQTMHEMRGIADTMESAFMAAERAAEA
jgi:hypothetical protein